MTTEKFSNKTAHNFERILKLKQDVMYLDHTSVNNLN